MTFSRRKAEECPHLTDVHTTGTTETKCADCDVTEHLRLCTACARVFCCESDNAHNRAHFESTGHPIIRSVPSNAPYQFTWCWECNAYLTET